MRDSCFNCKYTKTKRATDFTIADFWCVEKNTPEYDDNKGVSLVLLRGEKAQIIFKELDIKFKQTDINNSLQPQLIKPISKSVLHNFYWKKYSKNQDKAIRYLLFPSKLSELFFKIRRKLYTKLKK